jgi:prepilin-type N-terminal cleavage/methylation domain-containing protein
MIRQGALKDERGFTLSEMMTIIAIIGILSGIALFSFSGWFRLIENRRVTSATNQVVADLHLAHSQAINRLTDTSFIVPSADSSTYQIGLPADLKTRTLPGNDQGTPKTKILDATNIVFKANGEAITPPDPPGGPPADITVAATDGAPVHTININTVTSRIQVDP